VLTAAGLTTETTRESCKNLHHEPTYNEALTCARLARDAERIHSDHRKQLHSGENAAEGDGPRQGKSLSECRSYLRARGLWCAIEWQSPLRWRSPADAGPPVMGKGG
jgi:hypothetical protein